MELQRGSGISRWPCRELMVRLRLSWLLPDSTSHGNSLLATYDCAGAFPSGNGENIPLPEKDTDFIYQKPMSTGWRLGIRRLVVMWRAEKKLNQRVE